MFIRICDTFINLDFVTDFNYRGPCESDPASRLVINQAAPGLTDGTPGQAALIFSGEKADALRAFLCDTLSPIVVPYTPSGKSPAKGGD